MGLFVPTTMLEDGKPVIKCHSYVGVAPPFDCVAVKVNGSPLQSGLFPVVKAMLTDVLFTGSTVIVMALLFTGRVHVTELVISQVITSLSARSVVMK